MTPSDASAASSIITSWRRPHHAAATGTSACPANSAIAHSAGSISNAPRNSAKAANSETATPRESEVNVMVRESPYGSLHRDDDFARLVGGHAHRAEHRVDATLGRR